MPHKVVVIAFIMSNLLWSDVIVPHSNDARERLRKNPNSFDRTDQFCEDNSNNQACSIAGAHFSGGGNGMCRNHPSKSSSEIIDLTCIRQDTLEIHREIPSGGFVGDSSICKDGKNIAKSSTFKGINCKPISVPLTDQFCHGKKANQACEVNFYFNGHLEKDIGACKEIIDYEYIDPYSHIGHYRTILQCEPSSKIQHEYHKVNVINKLFQ